ncbi:MAG: phospho-sugar mutase [Acidimicrobiales bacterium]
MSDDDRPSAQVLAPAERAVIERWIALDPDPATKVALETELASDPAAANARFGGRIGFGTAGLRAPMAPGPMAMNRLVVRQTTLGLLRWLDRRRETEQSPAVVVGYDARYNSKAFAEDVAAVVAGAGVRAEILGEPTPTPVLALAVLERTASAGVMITASHNPAADNGYKLYLADGIQLVGPADAEIAAEIERVAMEMSDQASTIEEARSVISLAPEAVEVLDNRCARLHRDAARRACVTTERDVRVLYTAMHGVGGKQLLDAFAAAGFPEPDVVPEQFDPDPDFPTAPYPNPEEAGALDLALQAAADADGSDSPYDVILANDPDADRLAAAVPGRDGRWRALSGDHVGVLLADHLLANTDGDDRLVASSLVSSRLISAMADAAGVADVRTLTGFKWVARPIVDRPNHRFLLGYEEALGYCVGDRVRDKDGISAALVFAELVAGTKRRGESLHDRLDQLALRHGLYRTRPVTLVFAGPTGTADRESVMASIRTAPPQTLGGVDVAETVDLADGDDLPPTDGVVWHLVDRSRVIVRPSGTEPKLKAYLEVIEPVADAVALDSATTTADARLDSLAAAVRSLLLPENKLV